jgi:hypothetical protein
MSVEHPAALHVGFDDDQAGDFRITGDDILKGILNCLSGYSICHLVHSLGQVMVV